MTETSVEAALAPSVYTEGVRSVSVHETGVTTNDASARVQRVPIPVASPGACVLCGKYNHPDGFVFFGLDFEFYGTLYFCADCSGDIAAAFDWISPDRALRLQADRDSAVQLNDQLVERIQLLENALESLTRYSVSGDPESDAVVTALAEQVNFESDDQPKLASVTSISNVVTEQPGDESDVSEPASEQGPDDVSEPTGGESESEPVTNTGGSYLDVISELGLD